MKRGTTPTLKVKIGVANADISTIDFIFKQDNSESCTTHIDKEYPTNVTYNATDETYSIPFSEADTRTFKANSTFYMDTRINLTNNKIPETSIVTLMMNPTLFSTEDD